MGKRGSKKLRGSRGSAVATAASSSKDDRRCCDLMVTLPAGFEGTAMTKTESDLLARELRDRLLSTGYAIAALTHTIYGRPDPEKDRADAAVPDSLLEVFRSPSSSSDRAAKKRKRTADEDAVPGGPGDRPGGRRLRVLRRLHVVLEQVSDAGLYVRRGPHERLLSGYDLVSVAPANEAAFSAACAGATAAEIVTLDYSSRAAGRFRIRSADVKAATDRGAALEIPMAPALLHLRHRKAMVRTCRELASASLGSKPRIFLSSGPRTLDGRDAGSLAIRMPGDLSNLRRTVLGLGDEDVAVALSVVRRGTDIRDAGATAAVRLARAVRMAADRPEEEPPAPVRRKERGGGGSAPDDGDGDGNDDDDDSNDGNDGFIAL